MSVIKRLAPKKFLCRYPLSQGALIAAVTLLCVTLVCGIALIVQVLLMKNCQKCGGYEWRNAYSFSISGVIYCFIMLVMHGWLIWGVKKKKTTVILSWVVITTMWWSQTFFLLIILLCIHSAEVNFVACILAFTFGMIAICILFYLILVVFGLWIELKDAQKVQNIVAVLNN
ncbi:uncharacterized protein LOC123873269 [Maniola jurtina]|uniref:uncharacterized protein LOC123873269 n=1 Tax=Maniola jurtina TaxID=191418 RepID=UPI001E68DE2F|nr:uncharacterized protein LOC123873269 [Maniola jurtina]